MADKAAFIEVLGVLSDVELFKSLLRDGYLDHSDDPIVDHRIALHR